jgi:hypothetical protein
MCSRNYVEEMDMDMVMLEDNHSDSMKKKKKNWLNHKKNNLSNWTLLSFYLPSAIKLVPDKKKNLSLYQLSRISTLSLSTCKENSPSYTDAMDIEGVNSRKQYQIIP